MNVRAASLVLAVLAVFAASLASCAPLGLEGASCEKGPCAAGLTCVDAVCTLVEPPPPPPPPCESAEDCSLNGSADGRECVDGACQFAACFVDLQCGVRICDDGVCADRTFCLSEDDCDDDQICTDGTCRTACVADGDCPALGGVLQACVEGECLQRCLGDFMCITGGICEENVCADPQCSFDDDCTGPGDEFCEGGRCVQFTPCEVDDDCFDPNFFCNELGRCAERALCTTDASCGAGLCLDNHCRDAVACVDGSECAANGTSGTEECVAGRCVPAPECRGDDDCTAPAVCDRGRCADPEAAEYETLVVTVRPRAAFVGDSVDVRVQAYDADGLPVRAGTLQITGADCAAAGTQTVTIRVLVDGTLTDELSGGAVTCVDDTAADLDLLVLGADGTPAANADVFVGSALVGATGATGHYAEAVFAGGDVGARTVDGVGTAILGAAPGRLYVTLGDADAPATTVAGFTATVNGNGDEQGEVGLALALAPVAHPLDATLDAMLGSAFAGSIEVPILGAVPVVLPAAAIMDATLALVGAQEVKGTAFATAPAGPGQVLAFEGRFPQQRLFDVAFGADPTETALDLVTEAEGMDVALAGAGTLEARALVVDGDLADGVEDVDGDGDVGELVPDWFSFPAVDVVPTTPPLERVGLRTSAPPEGANPRAFAACGVELPTGFLPLGVGAVFGSVDGASEQLKVLAAPAGMSGQPRACVVHAIHAGGTTSAALARATSFDAALDVGALLAPPEGAFVLDGVPSSGRASIVVPNFLGSDAMSIRVFDGSTTWDVVSAPRGSVPLPEWIVPVVLAGTRTMRMDGGSLANALAAPHASIDDVVTAVATAP